jgi:tRNA U34 5-carboxymethylaminomethyl modifying GTPase MnmE/TrmE
MNIESKLEEINDELKQFQKNVEITFDRLVTNIQTPEVKEKVKHFKDIEISKISKNILQTIQVIDAPISVGLVGRYSHGKTALVNEFFSMDTEYSLPEGEGIVTSKITKVEFDSKVSSPICSQVFRDRRENRISLEALKLSVSTNDTNSELIDYYSIKLPVREDYSKLFESKKINLIDMPGLGGAYFKDNEKTRKYVDNVDMLIVVIKITEIKEAARCIEPYIHNLSIPIIPVLTFFDVWTESPTFVACSNDEEAICKAKELIKDLIPSLLKHEIRTIAVSSKTKHNIRALREGVCNFVEPQNFALQKIKSETPEVFRRRVREVQEMIDPAIMKNLIT